MQRGPLKEPVLCCVKKSQRLRKRQQPEAAAAPGEYAVGFPDTNRNTVSLQMFAAPLPVAEEASLEGREAKESADMNCWFDNYY